MHLVSGDFPPRPHRVAPWPAPDDARLDARLAAMLRLAITFTVLGGLGLIAVVAGWVAP